MSKLIEKAIYRRLSSLHSGGHAKTEAAEEAFKAQGETVLQQLQVLLTGSREKILYSDVKGLKKTLQYSL